jgi:hypothetical protein
LFAQLKHPNPHLRDRAMLEIAETISKLMSAFSRGWFTRLKTSH